MTRLLAAALLCLSLPAQTRVEPWQIRDWRQVAPLVGARPGTQVAVEQIHIDPTVVAYWRKAVTKPGPDCYELAVLKCQEQPYLVTRCVGWYPRWFETRWDGGLYQLVVVEK